MTSACLRVLVLGCNGFVGSAIVRQAKALGYDAIGVDCEEYRDAVGTTCDILVNANGNSRKYLSNQEPMKDFDLSVRSVAQSLHDFHFSQYVYLSTIDVYPVKDDPKENHEESLINTSSLSRYGHHKWLAEELVRYNAPSWLILRMGGFVGPGLRKNSIYDLLQGKALRVHPDSAYQYQHTDDLARIAFELVSMKVSNEIFNVAGDGAITLREVAAMIPGCTLPHESDTLDPERYEVNVERIKTHCPIAPTRKTVERFIQAVRCGKEVTA